MSTDPKARLRQLARRMDRLYRLYYRVAGDGHREVDVLSLMLRLMKEAECVFRGCE